MTAKPQHNSVAGAKRDLETEPVQLVPHDHSSEREDERLFTPAPPHKRVGFAIVGLGGLALRQIMPAFAHCRYAKPVALVSGDKKKAGKIARQYGLNEKNIYNYDNFDTIRDNPEIDVVYIVLPNNMHEEFTVRAARAGKHVLCEKPMAITTDACQRMIEACKKADRKLMIGYRIQYEPYNKLAMKWTREKKYGAVKVIDAFNGQNLGDPTQWRLKKSMGGGALLDVGIYCINTSRYLLGEEPEAVMANVFNTPGDGRFTEVDETVLFQLHFSSGVRVNCTTSFSVHENRRYRCYADRGAWFGMDPAFSYKGLQMEISQSVKTQEWKQYPSIGEKNHFALEMDHMAQCVVDNKEPYTKGEEGLQDIRIIEAIFKSAQEGKTVRLVKAEGKDPFRGTKPLED